MRQRCSLPNNVAFANYGGRGIRVCARWEESFEAFVEDMGERPSLQHFIDRIDSDGHYEPGNCRWATMAEQQCNRRNNRLITCDGKTMTISQWAVELGCGRATIGMRLASGWSTRDAVTTPVRVQRNNHR